MNNNLPDYFLHLTKVTGAQTHIYNTRFRNNVRQIQLGHEFRWKCLHYEIARIANNTPPNIYEKVCTHSYNGFILYIKCTPTIVIWKTVISVAGNSII